MAEFTGFPRAAITFLEDLEANNDRDWFKANRGRYEEHLVAPMTALAADLADLGTGRLFRPFNDARFHSRPPIKEHIGLAIGMEGAIGHYVELSLDGVFVAAGMYAPMPDQVQRLRDAVVDGRRAGGLTKALGVADRAGLERSEPDLKRAPRGFAPDHPRIELLRHRKLTLHRRTPVGRWVHGSSAGGRIRADLDAMTPTVRWLRNHVGPSTQERKRR
jgi:uncharacterized protein (TIGR02453 family)